MHKLGEALTSEEEKEKIRRILTARRKLCNAGVELLECDRIYAGNIKAELESLTIADYMPFEGNDAEKRLIDETDIRLFLETRMRIYVREENITLNTENGLCRIQLNDELVAEIPMLTSRRTYQTD